MICASSIRTKENVLGRFILFTGSGPSTEALVNESGIFTMLTMYCFIKSSDGAMEGAGDDAFFVVDCMRRRVNVKGVNQQKHMKHGQTDSR